VTREATVELAPPWHTAALVGLILTVSATGHVLMHGGHAGVPQTGISVGPAAYLPVVSVQLAMAVYVCRVGRTKNALFALLGRRWQTPRQFATDLALAAMLFGLIEGTEVVWAAVLGRSAASPLLPHTPLERGIWVAVGLTIGVSEELVYRGYLQTQLAAFTGRPNVATLAQAVLFGIAHADQGAEVAIRMAIYGLAFGVVARARQSLLPCILCHVGTDVLSGLLARAA
jgi:membrane protease YdiL (CAAX protease family)